MNTTAAPACPVEHSEPHPPAACLLAELARALDWPCDCGKPGSQCTKDKDGNCG